MTRGEGHIRLQSLDVGYTIQGQDTAPAIVCIHGWASSRRMWISTQQRYGSTHRVIALDLPGHGDSDKPYLDWYSISNFAGIVTEFCRKLDAASPILMGHSMGGKISIKAASLFGKDIQRIILINPAISSRATNRSSGFREGLYSITFGVSRLFWPFATRLIERPPEVIRRRRPSYVVRNRSDLARTTADSAFGSIRAVLQEDITVDLENCDVPVLVVVGKTDETIPPSDGRLAADSLSDAQLIELDGGHHLLDESPEAIFSSIDAFFDLNSAAI